MKGVVSLRFLNLLRLISQSARGRGLDMLTNKIDPVNKSRMHMAQHKQTYPEEQAFLPCQTTVGVWNT